MVVITYENIVASQFLGDTCPGCTFQVYAYDHSSFSTSLIGRWTCCLFPYLFVYLSVCLFICLCPETETGAQMKPLAYNDNGFIWTPLVYATCTDSGTVKITKYNKSCTSLQLHHLSRSDRKPDNGCSHEDMACRTPRMLSN